MSPDTAAPAATPEQRCEIMTQALREWDPDAEVKLEADTGRLSILTTLPTERVVSVLHAVGESVELERNGAARENCCGCGCSHGD